MFEHAGEHVVGQEAHVLGEHAEDEPVDEMGYGLAVVAAPAQRLSERGKCGRRAFG